MNLFSRNHDEQQEVGIFNIGVEVVVNGLARSLYVGNVEEAGVRTTRESDTQLTTNR